MKLSPHKFAQYRTHHEIDVDMDEEFWPMMGILFTIWGGWTGVVGAVHVPLRGDTCLHPSP